MWDYLLNNIPLFIIFIIAIIICGADLIKAIGVWRAKKKEVVDNAIQEREEENELSKTLIELKKGLEDINHKLDDQDEHFSKIDEKIEGLITSDKNDIKGWIVEQYHKFYVDQGWIDAFSANTLDLRYEDYKNEGGNSYIDTLMERLHSLPMDPPFDRNN
jgi:hypothetical protein